MGEMNFLQGGYQGKLGTTYGVRQYKKAVVKVVPFSHTPHNQTQKDSFSAFAKLQRFAAPIAKTLWATLELKNKNIHKLNAVVSWLKPAIKDHDFKLQTALDLIGLDYDYMIKNATFVIHRNAVEASGTCASPIETTQDRKDFFVFYNQNTMKQAGVLLTKIANYNVAVPVKITEQGMYTLVLIQTGFKNGKAIRYCYAKAVPCLVFYNEIFTPFFLFRGRWWAEEPETLRVSGCNTLVKNECLTILKD